MKSKLKAYVEEQRKRVIETYKMSKSDYTKCGLAGQMHILNEIDKLFCKD